MKTTIPDVVIRRLPRYYRYLSELCERDIAQVSSQTMAREMNMTASRIRQDLWRFGDFGQQGYGYAVKDLREAIGNILGVNKKRHLVIFGVGNLGHALMQSFDFSGAGFSVDAAFDVAPTIIGTAINGVPVYSINTIDAYFRQHQVDVVVLALPQEVAQKTVQHLIDLGIRYFWNFTNAELRAGQSDVTFENIHFADSLLRLSYQITHA